MATDRGWVIGSIDAANRWNLNVLLQIFRCHSSHLNYRVKWKGKRGYGHSYGGTKKTKHFWKWRGVTDKVSIHCDKHRKPARIQSNHNSSGCDSPVVQRMSKSLRWWIWTFANPPSFLLPFPQRNSRSRVSNLEHNYFAWGHHSSLVFLDTNRGCYVVYQGACAWTCGCSGQKICPDHGFVSGALGDRCKRCWRQNLYFWVISIRRTCTWFRYRYLMRCPEACVSRWLFRGVWANA